MLPTPSRSSHSEDRLRFLFPDPITSARTRRTRRARVAVASVVALTLVGGGVAAAGASDDESARYRTATVGNHDVDALFEGVASVEAVTQAAVSFPVAGTVDALNVAVGDTVATGTVLASLDTTSLTEVLHTKQATLAQAELALANALASEDATAESTTATVAPTTTAPARAASSTNDVAKRAVTDAQRAVDSALAAAATASSAADAVCADPGGAVPQTTSVPSTTAVPTTTVPTTTVPTTDVPPTDLTACRTALREVSTTQAAVTSAQQALAAASAALDQALTAASTSTAVAPSTASGSSTPAGPAASSPSGGFAGSGASSVSTSAEGLIAAQKAVDAAALEVIVADHAITQSDIVAPVDGTVVAVGLAVGDDVSAASATAGVTIVGSGGYEITTTVSVDQVPDIAVGQPATVLVDGSAHELTGEVVAIGVAPDASSTSYRVVIGLTGPNDTADLRSGATASVAIVTDSTTSALAVPTSAVTTAGDQHSVTLLTGSGSEVDTEDVTVQVGVMGDTWTEITSGVEAGDRVVLADLDEALPGSATETSTSDAGAGVTGQGGFPGGGFPGGGFGGGGPPAGFRPAG